MPIDLPPPAPMRVIASEYLDAYVDGQFCQSTSQYEVVHRVDVTCVGVIVELRDINGNLFAVVPWENWHLTDVR